MTGNEKKMAVVKILDTSNQKHFIEHIPTTLCMSNLMLYNFIEITLRDRCSPVHLLYIFRTPFPESSSGGLLLAYDFSSSSSADKKSFLKLFTSLSLNIFRVFATYCQWFFTAFAILLLSFT